MSTIKIKYSEIPAYLREGQFYRNLNKEEPEDLIEIPADCFKQDGSNALNQDEFCQLLRAVVFWALDDIPFGALSFCADNDVKVWRNIVRDHPGPAVASILPALLTAYTETNVIPLDKIFQTRRKDIMFHALARMDKNSDATAFAAETGVLGLLRLIHASGFKWHEETCAEASKGGHLDCLKFAREQGCPWGEKVYEYAAQQGHVHIMRYAHQEGLAWHPRVCALAALKGQLQCLQFAHEHGCPWDGDTVTAAAEHGHVECLKYALQRGCPSTGEACNLACRKGHLECLQQLYEFGAPLNVETTFCASDCADASCLQFLHEHDCPWNDHTAQHAAFNGKLNPLRYLMEHNCPYSSFLLQGGARSDSIECLKYLVEDQLLPLDEEVFKVALLHGNLACLQYLVEQGCPCITADRLITDQSEEVYDLVFRRDNKEFVSCMHYALERGWKPDRDFIVFVLKRDSEVCVEWLLKEGLVRRDMSYSDQMVLYL